MKSIVLSSALGVLCFCAGCSSLERASIATDRSIYDAIAPEYRAYVEGDERLTELQKTIRIDTIHKWNYLLAIREGLNPHERYGRSIPE